MGLLGPIFQPDSQSGRPVFPQNESPMLQCNKIAFEEKPNFRRPANLVTRLTQEVKFSPPKTGPFVTPNKKAPGDPGLSQILTYPQRQTRTRWP